MIWSLFDKSRATDNDLAIIIKTHGEFGGYLRQEREKNGLSREKLAARVGLDVSHVFRLETGGRRPSRDTVLALADALKVNDETVSRLLLTAGYAPVPALGAVRGTVRARGGMRSRGPAHNSPLFDDKGALWHASARARRLDSIGLTESAIAGLLDAMSSADLADQQEAAEALSGAFARVSEALESPVRTAVIPVGGGQHRLVAAHVMQRLIIGAIGEAAQAGISEIVLVLAPGTMEALYTPLKQMLDFVVVPQVRLLCCEQPKPEGLGDAILRSESLIQSNPFAVLLPDDVLLERAGKPIGGELRRMISVWKRLEAASLVSVAPMPRARLLQGGVARLAAKGDRDNAFPILQLAEKPRSGETTSTASNVFGIVGRYVMQPSVFGALHALSDLPRRPLELTEALARLLSEGAALYGYKMAAGRQDIGVVLNEARELIGN